MGHLVRELECKVSLTFDTGFKALDGIERMQSGCHLDALNRWVGLFVYSQPLRLKYTNGMIAETTISPSAYG